MRLDINPWVWILCHIQVNFFGRNHAVASLKGGYCGGDEGFGVIVLRLGRTSADYPMAGDLD
jgi:hypothetical protein